MLKTFRVTDRRMEGAFPTLDYRFSSIRETEDGVILERDFLGENPLHYYCDITGGELIVANNLKDIKDYLEAQEKIFTGERARAVSNNTRTTIDNSAFFSASPKEEERGPTLQEYNPYWFTSREKYFSDINNAGRAVKQLLQESLETRLSTVPDEQVGLLLSGGLDSMSVGVLLSPSGRKVRAFTLKVDEDDRDIVKSRGIAERLNIGLTEVKIGQAADGLGITVQKYNPTRKLEYERTVAQGIDINETILHSLRVSGNPKKDNVFCAVAMHMIGLAIRKEGIKTVFCGEGPNEMLNDYGFDPRESGYATENRGDVPFREALTFGLKKTDRQFGRGGLPKHAIARMGKMFAHHGLRLEAPYFDREIARLMTRVPHSSNYDTIKQHLVGAMFEGEGLDHFIHGTVKEKFQDGSGISRLFRDYDQKRLIDMFEEIYGLRKTGYLK